jgi:NAD(P)H-nitrite reductase large subunit
MGTVIVGSGLAGVTVAEGLRKGHPDRSVTLITTETLGVYPRPLLSHGFTREAQREKLILKTFDALRAQGIEVLSGAEVLAIDRAQKILRYGLANGDALSISYEHLVLAPGSAAFVPPSLQGQARHFFTLNSLADLDRLNQRRKAFLDKGAKPRVSILGGGLIGCEVAADLAGAGDTVSVVHGSDRLLERVLDAEGSMRLHQHFVGIGVSLHFQKRVDGIQILTPGDSPASMAFTESGRPVTSEQDILLVATGFSPRSDLARRAGLKVNRGIVVNGQFQTDDSSIFVVGDAAEVAPDPDKPGTLYPFVAPIRSQALHLVGLLTGTAQGEWTPPAFKPVLKVPGFKLTPG